jgi:hypothetical protein
METIIICALCSSFFLAIFNEVIRLRWWKAPLAVALSTCAIYVVTPHVTIAHKVVLVCATSFLSLLLLLIADRLATPLFPPVLPPKR